MDKILAKIDIPYLTTEYLLDIFKAYKAPRDKLKNLVRQKELIPVKQGLYILGPDYKRSYAKEVLAGMIYGPSAISFEYALYHHGFIPERVEEITSICFKRNKVFRTPLGTFTYKYMARELYPIGIQFCQSKQGNFFLASPEKALCDLAYFQHLKSDEEAAEYVIDDLRVDIANVCKLNLGLLLEISKLYKRSSVIHLADGLIIRQHKETR